MTNHEPLHTGEISTRATRSVLIPADVVKLHGDLTVPSGATGVVLFAHGTGSGRLSPRNRQVAGALNSRGIATLLLDLLSEEEERADASTGHLRFDIGYLAMRLDAATEFIREEPATRLLTLGYFGASTGAAAALVAAAIRRDEVAAVVSRGGRPDLAGTHLEGVRAATLPIVGGEDHDVIELNDQALQRLHATPSRLEIIPGATHLFEERGTLEAVERLAGNWFAEWFERFRAKHGAAHAAGLQPGAGATGPSLRGDHGW